MLLTFGVGIQDGSPSTSLVRNMSPRDHHVRMAWKGGRGGIYFSSPFAVEQRMRAVRAGNAKESRRLRYVLVEWVCIPVADPLDECA